MGLDSVELLMEFEKTFDHEVSNTDAEKMYTINDAVEYFYTHLKIQPKEKCSSQKLFYELREYFSVQLNISRELFTIERQLKELLPSVNRKQIWKDMENATGYKLPYLKSSDTNSNSGLSLLGINFHKGKPVSELTIQRFIDSVFSLNYSKLVSLPAVTTRYEIERIIIGITSDKCGIEVQEIETHHAFTNDLGID